MIHLLRPASAISKTAALKSEQTSCSHPDPLIRVSMGSACIQRDSPRGTAHRSHERQPCRTCRSDNGAPRFLTNVPCADESIIQDRRMPRAYRPASWRGSSRSLRSRVVHMIDGTANAVPTRSSRGTRPLDGHCSRRTRFAPKANVIRHRLDISSHDTSKLVGSPSAIPSKLDRCTNPNNQDQTAVKRKRDWSTNCPGRLLKRV
ncbi:hypothetical protein XA68_11752 [Ophiocordyceps unilateralis]|uniref:Uncharacterized protein n=1 Tax=Ophiocordyceps unilateralis TaxID=268505 RepID=A0A2A9PG57_OPHUN|nr:hypothetical protein XA68_11752 [Ophiocordyceps unilateralis]